MPIGIIINALSIVSAESWVLLWGHKLSPKFKEDITLDSGYALWEWESAPSV